MIARFSSQRVLKAVAIYTEKIAKACSHYNIRSANTQCLQSQSAVCLKAVRHLRSLFLGLTDFQLPKDYLERWGDPSVAQEPSWQRHRHESYRHRLRHLNFCHPNSASHPWFAAVSFAGYSLSFEVSLSWPTPTLYQSAWSNCYSTVTTLCIKMHNSRNDGQLAGLVRVRY